MKEQGKTILITTHDMQEAQNICDRVLIMNMGKIIRDADPDTLRKNFKQKSVISFKIEEELSSELIEKLENLFNYKTIKKNFYEFWSDVPLEDISILNRFIKAHKIKVINLQIKQASLEEVFIELIKKTKNGDDNV
jgi:ABC-2 type transport system ATP-binding protein